MSDNYGDEYYKKLFASLGQPASPYKSPAIDILKQYSTDNPNAQFNLETAGKTAPFEGAPIGSWMPNDIAATFKRSIEESDDPIAMENRLNSSYFLSQLKGISFEDAFRDHDEILAADYGTAMSPKTWYDAVANTWKATYIQNETSKLASQLLDKWKGSYEDIESDPLYTQILELNSQMPPSDVIKRSLPTKFLKAFAQLVPSVAETSKAGGLWGMAGMILATGAAAAAGVTLAPAIGIGATVAGIGYVTLPSVAFLSNKVFSTIGASIAGMNMERGQAYLDMINYRDPKTGERVNPTVAATFSTIYGGVAGLIEGMEFNTIWNTLSGMNTAKKRLLDEALSATLKNLPDAAQRAGTMTRILNSTVGMYGKNVASETLQETLQEGTQIWATDLARQVTNKLDGKNIAPITTKEITQRIVDTIVTTAMGSAVLGGAPVMVDLLLPEANATEKGKKPTIKPATKPTVTPPTAMPKDAQITGEQYDKFAVSAAKPVPAGTHFESKDYGGTLAHVAGDSKGKQLAYLTYTADPAETESDSPGTLTITTFSQSKSPAIDKELVLDLAKKYAGWDIEFEARTPAAEALKTYLEKNNRRGTGVQWFSAAIDTPDVATLDSTRAIIQNERPNMDAQDVEDAVFIVKPFAVMFGMTTDDLVGKTLAPEVLAPVMGENQQGVFGAAKQVSIDGVVKTLIDLAPNANPATFTHESVHAFMTFAQNNRTVPQIDAFMKEAETVFGVKDGDWKGEFQGWTDDYKYKNKTFEEAIAYGLEDYIATGKAPTPETEGFFKRMAKFLYDLYQSVKARVKLTPKMTAFYDKLFTASPVKDTLKELNTTAPDADNLTLKDATILHQGDDNTKEAIYRDALHQLSYKATISVYGADYGQPGKGYFSLRGANDEMPEKRWPYVSKDVSNIVAEMEKDGWDVKVSEDGYGAPVLNVEHQATKTLAQEKEAALNEKWKNAKDVYVRYGKLPPGGKSKNYRDNITEEGVSVFHGKLLPDGSTAIIPRHPQEIGTYSTLMNEPIYIVEGDEIGSGSDGEPLLANAKQYKPKDAARRLFIEQGTASDTVLNQGGISPEVQAAFDKAIDTFGTTNNVKEAGYVLPDGKMLDFSGRNDAVGYTKKNGKYIAVKDDYLKNSRAFDHRNINKADGLEMDMFEKLGGIRMDAVESYAEMGAMPTNKQWDVIKDFMVSNGFINITMYDGKRYADIQTDSMSPAKAMGYIRRFYNGEDFPNGNILFQGDYKDEVLATAKNYADTGQSVEQFIADMEAPIFEDTRIEWSIPDLSPEAKNAWYRKAWDEANSPAPDTEPTIAEWVKRLADDNYAGIRKMLSAIWENVIQAQNIKPEVGADPEEITATLAIKDAADEMRAEIAEPIIAGALAIGAGRNVSTRFFATLMGIIKANPEAYARIAGDTMNDAKLSAIGKKAETVKNSPIEDIKLQERMTISERTALAADITDEKLAKEIISGKVVAGDNVAALIKKLKSESKASAKRETALNGDIKALESEVDANGITMGRQRVELRNVQNELKKIIARTDKLVNAGQEIPESLASQRVSIEKRRESIRGKLVAAQDWMEIERQMQQAQKLADRADLDIQQAKARGEEVSGDDVRTRQENRAKIAELSTKLAVAKDYKNSAQLQTYLAALEERTKGQDAYQKRDAERRALEKLKRYHDQLVARATKAPGKSVAVSYAQQILDLQDNPDIKKMSITELEALTTEIKVLADIGRAEWRGKRERFSEKVEGQSSLVTETFEENKNYKKPEGLDLTKENTRKLIDRLKSANYETRSARRFIRDILDGGVDGANVQLLWHDKETILREDLTQRERRHAFINQAILDADQKPESFFTTEYTIEGAGPQRGDFKLRKTDLMAVELAFRNEDSRNAVLYGEFFSANERAEHKGDLVWFDLEGAERFNKIMDFIDATLTPEDMKILEAFEQDSTEAAPRIARIMADIYNQPFKTVKHYFMIIRRGATEKIDEQMAMEHGSRAINGKAPPRKGFTKARVTMKPWSQTPVKLDLLTTWNESIDRQEHLIAFAKYAKEIDAIYRTPKMQEDIESIGGKSALSYLYDYIDNVKNPQEMNDRAKNDATVRLLRGNVAFASLAFRTASMMTQITTSLWPAMQYTGPVRLVAEASRLMTNPIGYLRETEGMSVRLRARAKQGVNVMMESIKSGKADTKLGRNVQKVEEIGMKGLELVDRYLVAVGWRAMYDRYLDDFDGDVEKAVAMADDKTMMTQPSAYSDDLAPMFRNKSGWMQVILQFQSSLNVIFQNIAYDLPAAVREKNVAWALGIVTSYAIAGILLKAVKTHPKDDETPEEKARRLFFWSITQATDSIPLVGEIATNLTQRLITGEKAKRYPETMFPGVQDFADGLAAVSEGDIEKATQSFIDSLVLVGAPTQLYRDATRVLEGDYGALLGRPKK